MHAGACFAEDMSASMSGCQPVQPSQGVVAHQAQRKSPTFALLWP